jgi:hypothetical protein
MVIKVPKFPSYLENQLSGRFGKGYVFESIDRSEFNEYCQGYDWKDKQLKFVLKKMLPQSDVFVINGDLFPDVVKTSLVYEFELKVGKPEQPSSAISIGMDTAKAGNPFIHRQSLDSIHKPLAEYIACKWKYLEDKLSGLDGESKPCQP